MRKSPIPLAVYRLAAKKLDTIAVSEGFLKLFDMESYEEAVMVMNFCGAAAAPNCRVFCTAGRCLLKS